MRCSLVFLLAVSTSALADSPTQVLPSGKNAPDSRLGRVRTLNDKDFFFSPPTSLDAWKERRQRLREKLLVATGLWPMPEKTPLKPTIHGKVDRGAYTVEKVFFASLPGHYVSGNLYRPKGKSGKRPGVLCPHGHWSNGRFYDAGEANAKKQIASGAEKTMEGARYPLQARYAQLARMGCVVFHYDMVGYADSTALQHRTGFNDVQAELQSQSMMGLQTWNSIRALDFLLSLPEVDPKRIAVTGGSGGGTQTFMLCAIDDRPTVSVPAVMVGTEMQGGCVCENCTYLRQEAGNVEIAGLFAPKPLALLGADDWTVAIEKKGYPELQKLYKLYDVEDKVLARCFPQFKHNYNQVSREFMYGWLNQHLDLGVEGPVREQPFEPIPPKELSVYNAEHPRPDDTVDVTRLRQYLTERSEKQRIGLIPTNPERLKKFQSVYGKALRAMFGDTLPKPSDVEAKPMGKTKQGNVTWTKYLLSRRGAGEAVPAVLLMPTNFDGNVVVWVHADGKKSILGEEGANPAVQQLLAAKSAVLAVDVYNVGELRPDALMPINTKYAGYTWGYNKPMLSQRVHDILTAVAFAQKQEGTKRVQLAGFGKAGPWVLLARALCGDAVTRTVADAKRFRFDKIESLDDEMMLPGASKFGGLSALTAVAAPQELLVYNMKAVPRSWLLAAYKAASAQGKLTIENDAVSTQQAVAWLLK